MSTGSMCVQPICGRDRVQEDDRTRVRAHWLGLSGSEDVTVVQALCQSSARRFALP